MTQLVVTVDEDASLETIVERMEAYHVKRLPVVRGEEVVGIVSRADIVRALGDRITRQQSLDPADRAIYRTLAHALHELPWKQRLPRFEVSKGVVDLYWLDDSTEWERRAARILVENHPGIMTVREHILS